MSTINVSPIYFVLVLYGGYCSSEVSWLCCEDWSVAVFPAVDAFVFPAQVEALVSVEVADGDQGAELEDGLGAFEASLLP
jgi:hypothetical protein